jgi:hypothetical protein
MQNVLGERYRDSSGEMGFKKRVTQSMGGALERKRGTY